LAVITRQALRTRIGRDRAWLRHAPAAPATASGTTTSAGAADGSTLVDTGIYSTAIDQLVRQRSVICITSGARRGDRRYATGPPTSAGVITVSPAFGAQIAGSVTYEVWDPDGPHPDIVDRMIDKALLEDCWRWLPVPITYVPYGDFGEELAVSGSNLVDGSTTAWTGTTATPSFVSQVPPQEFVRRAVRITATAGGGYLQSQSIDVDVDNRSAWRIEALCRAQGAGSAGGDARIVLRDLTAGADITPATALSWLRRGWGLINSEFTIPASCNQIAIRLVTQNNAEATDWAWVQAWPKDQTRFSLPQRIVALKHVGSTFVRVGDIFDNFKRAPFSGALDRREVGGTGVQLVVDPPPGSEPLWFYERDSFPTLTSATPAAADDDNTTWAADLWLRAAVSWELYRWLGERDRKTEQGAAEDGSSRPLMRGWGQAEAKALEELLAMQAEYGAQPMAVEDASSPAYRATIPVN